MAKKEAEFIDRDHCINCNSTKLKELAGGLFGDAPLRGFIENDPWGENPMPVIEKSTWSYVKCEDCSQMYHRYVLSPEWNEVRFSTWMTQEAIEAFEKTTYTPGKQFNKTKEHVAHILRLEEMTKDIRGDSDVRVLDFGCGWGDFLATADRFGFNGFGIDRSSGRRNIGQHTSVVPGIEELKKENSDDIQFHAITLFEVLEHLDEPLPMLQELSKLLLPGGTLILETPDCAGVTGINNEVAYRKIHPLDHINAFTSETLVSIAKRAGFSKIKPGVSHVTVDSTKTVKSELKHLLYGIRDSSTQLYFRKD